MLHPVFTSDTGAECPAAIADHGSTQQNRDFPQRQLFVEKLPLLALVGRAAPRVREVTACALGIPLLFASLNLAAYYYAFLLLGVLVYGHRPGRLALIFATEALSYSPMLFEDRDGTLHIYRSAVVALLLLALYAKPLRERLTGPFADESEPIRSPS